MKAVEKKKEYILEDRNKVCKEITAVMGVESGEESKRLNFSKHCTQKQNHLLDYLQEHNQDSNTHNKELILCFMNSDYCAIIHIHNYYKNTSSLPGGPIAN